MLDAKPEGNYRYLPSTGEIPFCSGVVADAGYEIVRATFERPVPWRQGYELIDGHLKALGRPRQALCGLELRCAAPYTREGFLEFNGRYAEVLSEWGLYGGKVGTGSTARTNIAPSYNAPPGRLWSPSPTSFPPASAGRPSWSPVRQPACDVGKQRTMPFANKVPGWLTPWKSA